MFHRMELSRSNLIEKYKIMRSFYITYIIIFLNILININNIKYLYAFYKKFIYY